MNENEQMNEIECFILLIFVHLLSAMPHGQLYLFIAVFILGSNYCYFNCHNSVFTLEITNK